MSKTLKDQVNKNAKKDKDTPPFRDCLTQMSHQVSFAELMGLEKPSPEKLDPKNNIDQASLDFFERCMKISDKFLESFLSLCYTKEELKMVDYSSFEVIPLSSPFAIKGQGRVITFSIDFVKPSGEREKKMIGVRL